MPQNPFKIEKGLLGDNNLHGKYKTSWVEESFDPEGDAPGKLSISHTNNYIGTGINRKKLWFFLLIISIGIFSIFLRVFQLEVINGDYYRMLAEGNRIRLLPILAERGIIYDRFNRDLIKNIPNFSLAIVPQDFPRDALERAQILDQLSRLTGINPADVESLLKKFGPYSYESITIKDHLDYDTALSLYVKNDSLPGVIVEGGTKRGYYFTTNTTSEPLLVPSLSHIIGYVGKLSDSELQSNRSNGYSTSDLIGKTGLEKKYESNLRGVYGLKKIEVNAIGKEQNVLAMEPPMPGNDLIVSLDLDAQKFMEKLVKETADSTGKHRISALAMNPTNGEILALVSWPAFDNNEFVNGIDKNKYSSYLNNPDNPLFNRVISGLYPPGSTVKLLVAAAALEENIVTKNTVVSSIGGIEVGGTFYKDWKAGGHGITNVTKALAWSVNTFFYYVGGGYKNFIGLGIDRLNKYFSMFGLSQKTAVDLPNESAGFIPSKDWKKKTKGETWYVGDTYNVSIGQGDLLVTPLQVGVWTAAVANGGYLVTPHLVQKTVDPMTKKVTDLDFPKKHLNGISNSNLEIVRQGMRDCVTLGSCKQLGALSFQSAGKTGTAQWSKTHPTHAWFTSFAPYQNPKIVVTVLIEDGGEGSAVAEPIAEKFLDWWGKKYL